MKQKLKLALSVFGLMLHCLFCIAQHQNIMISNQRLPNEVTIAINPKNTNQLVAASNINNVYTSNDAGKTWNAEKLKSSFGVWGDPCVIADTSGNFYFFHLSNPQKTSNDWLDRMVCQKSSDGGKTWDDGSFFGLSAPKDQDKEWAVYDKTTGTIHVTWTQFDKYASKNAADSSLILYTKSIDGGKSWQSPTRISDQAGDCIDSDNTTEGAVPAVGPNGEIYVGWSNQNKIWFDRSLDNGKSWLNNDKVLSEHPGGWDITVPGISRCNGMPVTVCDQSTSTYSGRVYVNWVDNRNGNYDVWMMHSADKGENWSAPIKVNSDHSKRDQFFTWATVDQITGYVYVVFYDRRNYDDLSTDVYMAVSKDGGNTFQNFKISETPFVPHKDVFFGDYINIAAHNHIIRPIWMRLHNGELSVWTALVDTAKLGVDNATIDLSYNRAEIQNVSNGNVSFKLRQNAYVSLSVYDSHGILLAKPYANTYLQAGKFVEKFTKANLRTGVFNATLEIDGKKSFYKIIIRP